MDSGFVTLECNDTCNKLITRLKTEDKLCIMDSHSRFDLTIVRWVVGWDGWLTARVLTLYFFSLDLVCTEHMDLNFLIPKKMNLYKPDLISRILKFFPSSFDSRFIVKYRINFQK